MKKLLTTIIFLISFNIAQSQSLVTQAAAIASFYPGHITAADLKNFAFSVCSWCTDSSSSGRYLVNGLYTTIDSLTNPVRYAVNVDTSSSGFSGKYLRIIDTAAMLSRHYIINGATKPNWSWMYISRNF